MDRSEKAVKSGASPALLNAGERETEKTALTDHSHVHGYRLTKHATSGGRRHGDASIETPVAHLH